MYNVHTSLRYCTLRSIILYTRQDCSKIRAVSTDSATCAFALGGKFWGAAEMGNVGLAEKNVSYYNNKFIFSTTFSFTVEHANSWISILEKRIQNELISFSSMDILKNEK